MTLEDQIKQIAHTFCMDYPMAKGTSLDSMSAQDCLDAIQWKFHRQRELVLELEDTIDSLNGGRYR